MDFRDRANALANKMNRLTEKFDLSDEMILEADDIIEDVKKKTDLVDFSSSVPKLIDTEIEPEFNAEIVLNLVNLQAMTEDFAFVRDTLKETTENARRVLNSITLDLLDSDEDTRASLILSFAELNSAVGNNMKLYMESYKNISNVLVNIDKVVKTTKSSSKEAKVINNTQINVGTEQINTAELLNRLRSAKEA